MTERERERDQEVVRSKSKDAFLPTNEEDGLSVTLRRTTKRCEESITYRQNQGKSGVNQTRQSPRCQSINTANCTATKKNDLDISAASEVLSQNSSFRHPGAAASPKPGLDDRRGPLSCQHEALASEIPSATEGGGGPSPLQPAFV